MKSTSLLPAVFVALAVSATGALASGSHAAGHDDPTAAIGEAGSRPTRTVEVDMNDAMRFTPASIAVKQGETIRFVVRNSGQVKHEMVLGTPQMLKDHYEIMKRMPGMEHVEANQVTVAPGKTGEIIWRFTKAGQVDFACLQPGHFDAGMKGEVAVR